VFHIVNSFLRGFSTLIIAYKMRIYKKLLFFFGETTIMLKIPTLLSATAAVKK